MSRNIEESSVYVIPQNYEDRAITAGGRSLRNIVEGAVMASFTIPIFIFLPIPFMYRAIMIAAVGGALFAFGAIGIKQCCVSEYIIKVIQFRQSSKEIFRNDEDIFDELLQMKQRSLLDDDETEDSQGETQPDIAQNIPTTRAEDTFSEEMVNNVNGKKKRKKGKRK